MTRINAILILILALFCSAIGKTQTADDILSKMAENISVGDKYAEIEVYMDRSEWNRTLSFKIWTRGEDLAYLQLTAPEREAGIVFLKNDSGLWNWQPKIKKTIQLPSSMMLQSWMGTDLTFDDLLGAATLKEKYNAVISGSENIEGQMCHVLTLLPKNDADVLWGKIMIWISKSGFLQLRGRYFDEDGELVHTMQASELNKIGGRWLPGKVEIIPASTDEGKTIIRYVDIDLNPKIPADLFNESNLGSNP